MIIENTDIATVVKYEQNSIENFSLEFSKKYSSFAEINLIIDFSNFLGVKKENILLFLQYSKQHKDNGMSFVIVVNGIDVDDLPNEISTAPTLVEANDIIEMEIIEKDLGI